MKIFALKRINNFIFSRFFRFLLLVVLLSITLTVFFVLRKQQMDYAQSVFSEDQKTIELNINASLKKYELMLLSIAGLYESSQSVERDEFHAFVSRLNLQENYKAVKKLGYIEWVGSNNVAAFIASIQAQGFADVAINPSGVREYYAPVKYIEPFHPNNPTFLGVDYYAKDNARPAMKYAVNSKAASLTQKLMWGETIHEVGKPAVLMFQSVFKKNTVLKTESQRWDALEGFIWCAFHTNDLLGEIHQSQYNDVNIKIYSGYITSPDNLLFSSSADNNYSPNFLQKFSLSLYGQVWTVSISSSSQFDNEHDNYLDEFGLVFGICISFLLFLLFGSLSAQRQNALLLAEAMTQDVYEKNKQLKRNEERLQLALESSAMGVWSWSLVDNIIQWDATMFTLFGLQDQPEIDNYKSFSERLHEGDRERVFQELKQAISESNGYQTEYRVIWMDASVHHIASRAKIIFDEHGVAVSMIGTCWDISESKRLDKLKSEFVSTVSHELRTPLTAITGALGLATSGVLGDLSDKAKPVLDIAYKNSQRLKLLINDLLDIDKLLVGKVKFDCSTQHLLPLIKRAVVENKAFGDQFNVRYVIAPIDPEYKVFVEDVRFLQVMANFLSNAAKFSPEYADVIVSVSKHNNWIRIAVSDYGIGISEEAKLHIFEKFYQADSSNTRKKGGTGLGLAITKEIVERMNGRVGFMSDIGVGSTFYAEFPLVDA